MVMKKICHNFQQFTPNILPFEKNPPKIVDIDENHPPDDLALSHKDYGYLMKQCPECTLISDHY